MNDNKLILQLKQGDKKAFEKVVLEYQDMIVNTCYRYLQNKEDAHDVAQEVFIEFYLKINTFRSESKLSTWLYKIAVNRSLNFSRDNKKHSFLMSIDKKNGGENSHDIVDQSFDRPGRSLERSDKKSILRNAINKLPENQKTAFILSKYQELSYKEIADVMEMSVSAIESLLHRAKKRLQKELQDIYRKKII